MFFNKSNRKHNTFIEDFIPIACHYDEHTIITKNGNLLQIIKINGLNSQHITPKLNNLRKSIREQICNIPNANDYAFWIHIIRNKANLDDPQQHQNLFSQKVHQTWNDNNHWDSKYINTLYITIVHNAPNINDDTIKSWFNAFLKKKILDYQNSFFQKAIKNLHNTVNLILSGLQKQSYDVQKLGIMKLKGKDYSEPISLYSKIIRLDQKNFTLPMKDISMLFGDYHYNFTNNEIQISSSANKGFAGILSIKDLNNPSLNSLDDFLYSPVEMVVTEMFYSVDPKQVHHDFKDQDYIFKVSQDNHTRKLKGIADMMDNNTKFCDHHISIMIKSATEETLNSDIQMISKRLSNVGIINICEDIELEQIFWLQLPGNFLFLPKMTTTLLNTTGSFISLSNKNIGHQYNPWGKALTLFQNCQNNPYFMNFHDQSKVGTTFIFGTYESGKTTLLNFLLSESDKYNPNILYFTDNRDSFLYIKAQKGLWLQNSQRIINPFLCDNNNTNKEFLIEFLKVIGQHYFNPLSDKELKALDSIIDKIFTTPLQDRKLSSIIDTFITTASIRKRFKCFQKGEKYYQIFEKEEPLDSKNQSLIAINLEQFNNEYYIKNHFPLERKLEDKFYYELHTMDAVKAGILIAFQHHMNTVSNQNPNIFAIDNISKILNLNHYEHCIEKFIQHMTNINGIFIATMDSKDLNNIKNDETKQEWVNKANTTFILGSEVLPENIGHMLNLSQSEIKNLTTMSSFYKKFLLKQDNQSLFSELNIHQIAITSILSSGSRERNLYAAILKDIASDDPNKWLPLFYKQLITL